MKTILYILIFNISTISFAQDPQLFDNTWYLHNVIIDGQNNTPQNSQYFGELNFNSDELSVGHNFCQAGFYANVIYDTTNVFNIDIIGILVDSCGDPAILAFIEKHYSIYMDNNNIPKNPLLYSITTSGSIKTLVITNPEGNQAIYGNESLSIQKFDKEVFSIHPNPVKNEVYLSSAKISGNLNIKILNIEGKLLSTQSLDFQKEAAIDVSNLTNGLYFLNIENENGNATITKFIKN